MHVQEERMLQELKSRLKSCFGECVLIWYGLLFLLVRLPSWIRSWLTRGRGRGKSKRSSSSANKKSSWFGFWKGGGGGGKKEKVDNDDDDEGEGEDRQWLCVAPSLLADPNIGRHMFVKIKVRACKKKNEKKELLLYYSGSP